MSRSLPRGTLPRRSIAALLLSVALFTAWPVTAAAPQSVAVGAPVAFSGSGFTANESIALWETAPGGATTPLPDTGADGSGAFSTTVSFPAAGQWAVTAQGKTSGKKVIGTYQVGGAAAAPAPVPTGAGTTGTSVAVGAPTTFSGTGMTANEAIAVWETAPDSTVSALPDSAADATGAFAIGVTFPTAGQWQVTAHGKSSGKEKVGIFQVGSTSSAAPPAGSPLAAPGSGGGQVAVGAPVTFSGTGFTANEGIAFWRTAPDTTTSALPDGAADANGTFTISVTFPTAGQWEVTAHGKTSGKEAVGTYTVGDTSGSGATGASATSNPPPGSSAPPATSTTPTVTTPPSPPSASASGSGGVQIGSASQVAAGSTATFTATGFTPGESVSIWEVKPGNLMAGLNTAQADASGAISVQISFDTPGPYQLIAQGQTSGHSAVTPYQVVSSS